jgi:hypothetical protein
MFFAIIRALCGRLNFCAFRLLQFGLFGALSFVMFAAPSNNAVAQFPGVGSEAPSGVAIEAGNAGSGSGVANAGNSDGGDYESSDVSFVSGSLDDGGGSADYQPSDSSISISKLKKKQQRKQLFIKKLRLEFVAIEIFERKTGLPFSRDNVPRYLDELRRDLKMISAREKKGEIVDGAVKSIGRDANYIETQLNQYLDQLLEHVGQPVSRKTFFAMVPVLPKVSRVSDRKLDELSLKFELADYGEKALQAMGAGGY